MIDTDELERLADGESPDVLKWILKTETPPELESEVGCSFGSEIETHFDSSLLCFDCFKTMRMYRRNRGYPLPSQGINEMNIPCV